MQNHSDAPAYLRNDAAPSASDRQAVEPAFMAMAEHAWKTGKAVRAKREELRALVRDMATLRDRLLQLEAEHRMADRELRRFACDPLACGVEE